MRWQRSILASVTALAALLAAPSAARAGGAAFAFDPRTYAPGQRVFGQASFDPTIRDSGRVEHGPFYAYLLPLREGIPPPAIPKRGVPLGPIAMTASGHDVAIATISFAMPDVRPGSYVVELCDDPCRHNTVGDFVGGTIAVARTPRQALAANVRDALSPGIDQQIEQVRGELSSQVEEVATRQSADDAVVRALAVRVRKLQRGATLLHPSDSSWAVTAAAVGWILAALLAARSVKHRRRRRALISTALPSS